MTSKNLVYPDIILIVHNQKSSDDIELIRIPCHKYKLYRKIPYFTKYFDWHKDSDVIEIKIEYNDVCVFKDVIMTVYKVPIDYTKSLSYIYACVKCYNFLNLVFDQKILKSVDAKLDFNTFLDIIDIVGYNQKNIKLLYKYKPKNYDLSKFPIELINQFNNIYQKKNEFKKEIFYG